MNSVLAAVVLLACAVVVVRLVYAPIGGYTLLAVVALLLSVSLFAAMPTPRESTTQALLYAN